MNHVRRRSMTTSEFLVWETHQERKWEFDGFQPVAMTGGTIAHGEIQGNIITALKNRLRGQACRPNGPETQVPIPGGSIRYPDAFVSCARLSPKARQATEPVVIFEVLSESTARVDRTEKLPEYLSIPTVRRYVMVEQDTPFATVVSKAESGWAILILREGETLSLPEIGVEIPIAEFYVDVEFEAESE